MATRRQNASRRQNAPISDRQRRAEERLGNGGRTRGNNRAATSGSGS